MYTCITDLQYTESISSCTSIVCSHGRGAGAPCPPWIFIHGTDIVDSGLIVLFFRIFLLFFVLPLEEAL